MNAELPPGWEFPFGTDAQGRDIYSRIVLRRAHLAHRRRRQPDLQQPDRRHARPHRRLLGRLVGRFRERPHQPDAGDPLADLRARHHGDPRARPGRACVIALGLTSWSYSCRIARAQVLSLKSQGYVQAARILGYGDLRIMFTQVLPNILGPLIVIATLGMGGAILAEAALSFLGLGIRPPFPSWGSMLSEARDQITRGAVALGVPRASPSSSPCSASTCWATACATSSTRSRRRAAHDARPSSRSTTCTSPLRGDGATYDAVENVSLRDRPRRGVRPGGRIRAAARASRRSPSWACCAGRCRSAAGGSCSMAEEIQDASTARDAPAARQAHRA